MHKFYIIENKNISKDDIDMCFSHDMYYNNLYKSNDEIKDYKDGILKFDSVRYLDGPVDYNKNNISVFKNTYDKLAYIVFCFTYFCYTKEDLIKNLRPIIEGMKKYVPDFIMFDFDKLTEQQIGNSPFVVPLNIEDEDPLYDCAGVYREQCFKDHAEEKGFDIADIIFQKRYILLIDDMKDDYIKRMIKDGIIDVNNKRIVCFYNYNEFEEVVK